MSKPLSCTSGIHKGLTTRIIMGIPCLYCTKCGQFLFQGLADKTWSKKDKVKAAKLMVEHKQKRRRTKREIMEQLWKKHQLTASQRRRRMEESIRKYVRKRMNLVK